MKYALILLFSLFSFSGFSEGERENTRDLLIQYSKLQSDLIQPMTEKYLEWVKSFRSSGNYKNCMESGAEFFKRRERVERWRKCKICRTTEHANRCSWADYDLERFLDSQSFKYRDLEYTQEYTPFDILISGEDADAMHVTYKWVPGSVLEPFKQLYGLRLKIEATLAYSLAPSDSEIARQFLDFLDVSFKENFIDPVRVLLALLRKNEESTVLGGHGISFTVGACPSSSGHASVRIKCFVDRMETALRALSEIASVKRAVYQEAVQSSLVGIQVWAHEEIVDGGSSVEAIDGGIDSGTTGE